MASSPHGRPRGRRPRRTRTVPPHVCARRQARQLQLPLGDTQLGGQVAAAYGGMTCCFCGVALDGGYVSTFDGRLRCLWDRCIEAERKLRARAEGEAA